MAHTISIALCHALPAEALKEFTKSDLVSLACGWLKLAHICLGPYVLKSAAGKAG